MNIVIIEDEKPAIEKLREAIMQLKDTANLQAVLTSVEASVKWFSTHALPELIFMDVQLTDGTSFAIFDVCHISCPVIFTTAYDEYWQEAFEHNSIDYLLKPVRKEKLAAALNKYDVLKQHFAAKLPPMLQWKKNDLAGHKRRYLVRRGTDLVSVKVEDIAYFYATHKLVCLVTLAGEKYILDQSLADIEGDINPAEFFRLNRKYVVNVNAIKKMKAYTKGKLIVEVSPATNEQIIISQENSAAFKEWIGS